MGLDWIMIVTEIMGDSRNETPKLSAGHFVYINSGKAAATYIPSPSSRFF